jgi:isopentenyl-diphosphate Delta-isomerase
MEHLEDKFDVDPTAVERKKDHIEMAFQSQILQPDGRFYYEPMLSAHPVQGSLPVRSFLGCEMRVPIWVSSMTGGTGKAANINKNLARACGEFGMGMGLGSCRQLLYSDEHFADFNVRPLMGAGLPLFANLGVAQLEVLIEDGRLDLVDRMIEKLDATGLIIHVNPLQEWLQPEGDRFKKSPLDTTKAVLDHAQYPIIVKEVGQGFGYESIKALLQLPLAAIDFAASGGTNFAKLELLRSSAANQEIFNSLALVGHTAEDMVDMVNRINIDRTIKVQCKEVIISGGIKNFLDGYYCMKKLSLPSVYGQASGFLKHAQGDYAPLRDYVRSQIEGLEVAEAFLRLRK